LKVKLSDSKIFFSKEESRMKTAAKVFVILSIVCFAILFACYLILGVISLSTGEAQVISGVSYAGGVLIGVSFIYLIPIIVGSIALKKLKTATSHSRLVGMGVVTLLFCSLVGGILMLCIQDSDLSKK
jgi:heme/copper-type cytochrome/quinol oxidase subunit 3